MYKLSHIHRVDDLVWIPLFYISTSIHYIRFIRFSLPKFPPPLQNVGQVHEGVVYIEETNNLEILAGAGSGSGSLPTGQHM